MDQVVKHSIRDGATRKPPSAWNSNANVIPELLDVRSVPELASVFCQIGVRLTIHNISLAKQKQMDAAGATSVTFCLSSLQMQGHLYFSHGFPEFGLEIFSRGMSKCCWK